MDKLKLLTALEAVKPGLDKTEGVDQSNSFTFKDGKVITYNDEISISYPLEGLNFEGVIRSDEFYQYLKRVKKNEVEFSIIGNELEIKSGRSKAAIPLYTEFKLPLDEINGERDWMDLPDNFREALKMAMGATDKSSSDPLFSSLHITDEGYVEGTNSYKFMRYKLEELPVSTFLIPVSTVNELLKFDVTQVAQEEGWIFFLTSDGAQIACRTFIDKYHNPDSILFDEGEKIQFPKDINDILGKAEIFSTYQGVEGTVDVLLKKNKMIFSAQSEAGRFSEVANMEWDKEPVKFSIIPSLFKFILSNNTEGLLKDKLIKFHGDNWVYVGLLFNTTTE